MNLKKVLKMYLKKSNESKNILVDKFIYESSKENHEK